MENGRKLPTKKVKSGRMVGKDKRNKQIIAGNYPLRR